MPYATRTRAPGPPRPRRPVLPRPRAAAVVPHGTGQTVAQQLAGAAVTAQVFISFDPPFTPWPAWLDVSGFVDHTQPITITTGRADGLADPNAATCSLTVDNSDGRWTATNPSGAWNGLVRKGMWLRVDLLPLSGTVSRRFTGYVTALPTTIAGKGAESQISASDVMVLLTQAPKLRTMLVEEWMSDPSGAPYIVGYWPLDEPSGATYALDVSGQAPPGNQALAVRSFNVPTGSGITWSSTPAPGFDGRSTVAFAPSGTPYAGVYGGTSNALPYGTYLRGTAVLGAVGQVTCWVKTTTPYQAIWSWSDPTTNYSFGLAITPSGYAQIYQQGLAGSSSYGNVADPVSAYPITDGAWHQISVRLQVAPPGGYSYVSVAVDGVQTFYAFNSTSGGYFPPATLSRLTFGAAEAWNGTAATTALTMFTGALSDVVVHIFANGTQNPAWPAAYAAGATGHAGESTALRVARLVAYAGLPVPEQPLTLPGSYITVLQPTTGTSPVLNAGPTAHPAGTQAITGKNVLDAAREVARTENMPLFVDPYGRITLQPSTLRNNPTAAVTITAADLDPSTSIADDFQYTVNQTVVTPSGQGSITVNTGGTASQKLFGVYSTPVASVSLNAAEAASLGAAIIGAGQNPPPRVAPLAIEAATAAAMPTYGAAWYDAVLALTVSGVVQVTGWPGQSPYGTGGTSTHVIEGATETVTAGQHLIAWNTSQPQGPTYQCDTPGLNTVDTPGITLAY